MGGRDGPPRVRPRARRRPVHRDVAALPETGKKRRPRLGRRDRVCRVESRRRASAMRAPGPGDPRRTGGQGGRPRLPRRGLRLAPGIRPLDDRGHATAAVQRLRGRPMQSRAQHAAPKTAPAVCAKTRRDLPDAGQLPALWGRRLCVLRRRLVARRAGRAHRAVRVRARRRHPPAPALRDAHGQHPRAPRRDRPRDAAALLRRKDARRRESARRGRRRHGLRDGRVLPAGHVPGARRDGGAVLLRPARGARAGDARAHGCEPLLARRLGGDGRALGRHRGVRRRPPARGGRPRILGAGRAPRGRGRAASAAVALRQHFKIRVRVRDRREAGRTVLRRRRAVGRGRFSEAQSRGRRRRARAPRRAPLRARPAGHLRGPRGRARRFDGHGPLRQPPVHELEHRPAEAPRGLGRRRRRERPVVTRTGLARGVSAHGGAAHGL
mmetsp:Transcript_5590/g.17365  ORF Transcript_5590/g.17365 Transcript_5590/m.17365 type:complete len:439 (+) Transcript_5590:300-1616(+)